MAETIKVCVTQEDIQKGKPCSYGACPLARAMTRATGRKCFVGFSYFWQRNNKPRVNLPLIARKFVKCVDGGLPVTPFEFEVTI